MWLSVQVQLLPLGQARSSMSALADRPLAWMLSWTPSAAALPCLLLPLPLLAHHTSSKGFCSGSPTKRGFGCCAGGGTLRRHSARLHGRCVCGLRSFTAARPLWERPQLQMFTW